MNRSVGSKTTTTKPMECFRGLTVDLVKIILQFHPTAKTQLVGGDLGDGFKWDGGAAADNGCLHCIPDTADRVLEYNPATNTSSTIGKDLSEYGEDKWSGAIIGRDGNIYGLPHDSGTVLIINPHTKEVDVVDVSQEDEDGSYRGGVLAADGMIYLIPHYSDQVLRFNPTDRTATLVGQKFDGDSKWWGGVLGKDGCVYGIPCYASRILRFDPTTQIASLVGDDLGDGWSKWCGGGCCKWVGGAVDSDGIIYGVKSCGEQILRFDPATKKTSLIGSFYNIVSKWNGGVMGDDNNLYCIPTSAKQVLRLDTSTLRTSLVGDEYEGDCKWMGCAKGKNGIIYGVPCHHKQVLEIVPMTISGVTKRTDKATTTKKKKWGKQQKPLIESHYLYVLATPSWFVPNPAAPHLNRTVDQPFIWSDLVGSRGCHTGVGDGAPGVSVHTPTGDFGAVGKYWVCQKSSLADPGGDATESQRCQCAHQFTVL